MTARAIYVVRRPFPFFTRTAHSLASFLTSLHPLGYANFNVEACTKKSDNARGSNDISSENDSWHFNDYGIKHLGELKVSIKLVAR